MKKAGNEKNFSELRKRAQKFLGTMVSDISDRKELELAKLRRLKNRYRAIVMDQGEMICRFDPEGRVTFVNDAYCRFFKVDYWQILGTRFLPHIHEDDLSLAVSHFTELTRAEPEKTIEYRVWLPDGKLYWQQWSGRALFDENGELVRYQAVGRDITLLKETEKKLQEEVVLRQVFLDALPCIALLLNYHTREIIAANKSALAVGGVPGQRCYAGFAKRDSPCLWCRIPAGSWAHGQSLNEQFGALNRFWDAYWVPIDEDHCLHYLFDITEKQKIKEALQKAHDELENRVAKRTLELQVSHRQLLHSEKLAAAGRLSASIAHEFNSPLQSVQTILEGIGKYATLEEKEQELVVLALQECRRMGKLIANLRDFFRPTSGKIEQVDIHSIIDSVLLLKNKDLERRKIEIVQQYGRNIPLVMAVADQLKQVFLNLLSNAADACEGGGNITIIGEEIGLEDIVVHIKDSGIGIDPADMAHLFEPFFTTKPEKAGSGIGLSVSYGIIKNHGGHIDVKSKPGKGATFSVFLPVIGVSHEQ